MAVSVIVPVHNAEDFLGATLSSLANALNGKDQLILVFDRCTDNSLRSFSKWRKQAGASCSFEISHLETDCGSVAEARNAGLEVVCRPWLTFADHDDRVWPCGYRDLLSTAQHSGADVVRAGYVEQRSESNEIIYPFFSSEVYAFYGIFVWNSLFSSDLILGKGIKFIRGYGEDYEFNLNVSEHCAAQAFLRKPVYTWRIHGGNQHLSRKPEHFVERVFGIIERNRKYLMDWPNARAAFVQWVREYKAHMKTSFPRFDIEVAFARANVSRFDFNWKLSDVV